jgi:hypothetical protein
MTLYKWLFGNITRAEEFNIEWHVCKLLSPQYKSFNIQIQILAIQSFFKCKINIFWVQADKIIMLRHFSIKKLAVFFKKSVKLIILTRQMLLAHRKWFRPIRFNTYKYAYLRIFTFAMVTFAVRRNIFNMSKITDAFAFALEYVSIRWSSRKSTQVIHLNTPESVCTFATNNLHTTCREARYLRSIALWNALLCASTVLNASGMAHRCGCKR